MNRKNKGKENTRTPRGTETALLEETTGAAAPPPARSQAAAHSRVQTFPPTFFTSGFLTLAVKIKNKKKKKVIIKQTSSTPCSLSKSDYLQNYLLPFPFHLGRGQVCASFLQGSSPLLLSQGKCTVLNGLHWVQNGICWALTGRPAWEEPHKQRSVPNLVMLRIQKKEKHQQIRKKIVQYWNGIYMANRNTTLCSVLWRAELSWGPFPSSCTQHVWLGSCPAPRAQSSGERTQNSHQQSQKNKCQPLCPPVLKARLHLSALACSTRGQHSTWAPQHAALLSVPHCTQLPQSRVWQCASPYLLQVISSR